MTLHYSTCCCHRVRFLPAPVVVTEYDFCQHLLLSQSMTFTSICCCHRVWLLPAPVVVTEYDLYQHLLLSQSMTFTSNSSTQQWALLSWRKMSPRFRKCCRNSRSIILPSSWVLRLYMLWKNISKGKKLLLHTAIHFVSTDLNEWILDDKIIEQWIQQVRKLRYYND